MNIGGWMATPSFELISATQHNMFTCGKRDYRDNKDQEV